MEAEINDYNEFGAFMRSIRRLRGVKLWAIADQTGMPITMITRIERGLKGPPKDEKVRLWVNALSIRSHFSQAVALADKGRKAHRARGVERWRKAMEARKQCN